MKTCIIIYFFFILSEVLKFSHICFIVIFVSQNFSIVWYIYIYNDISLIRSSSISFIVWIQWKTKTECLHFILRTLITNECIQFSKKNHKVCCLLFCILFHSFYHQTHTGSPLLIIVHDLCIITSQYNNIRIKAFMESMVFLHISKIEPSNNKNTK